jgi:putative membrane protein
MKKSNSFLLALIVISMTYACNTKPKEAKDANSVSADSLPAYDSDTSVKDPADTSANTATTFALKAGAGGTMEVELGNIAQQNAQSSRVKHFGAMMIKDHTKANKELISLAGSRNILIPSKIPDKIQTHIDEMKKLRGAEFDKHYMDMMTDDHKEDIELFEKAARNLPDTTLKAFAARTLPTLKMHLDSAKAIKSSIK